MFEKYDKQPISLIIAILLTGLLYLSFIFAHELIHLILNIIFTGGEMGTCTNGFPFTFKNGPFRPFTCFASGGYPNINTLLTPYSTSVLALCLMFLSDSIEQDSLRWGTFNGSLLVWMEETFYGMGIYTPPTFTSEGIKYVGDGVNNLETFGYIAQAPGTVLVIVGIFIVLMRTKYDRHGTVF